MYAYCNEGSASVARIYISYAYIYIFDSFLYNFYIYFVLLESARNRVSPLFCIPVLYEQLNILYCVWRKRCFVRAQQARPWIIFFYFFIGIGSKHSFPPFLYMKLKSTIYDIWCTIQYAYAYSWTPYYSKISLLL